jgi:hypothetical protein
VNASDRTRTNTIEGDRPLQVGDQALLDGLRALDTESLLSAGYLNHRKSRLAREAGKPQLAAVHDVIGLYVDAALIERTREDPALSHAQVGSYMADTQPE